MLDLAFLPRLMNVSLHSKESDYIKCLTSSGLARSMMASVNMTSQKFEKWRRALAKELIAAYTHYHIWEQLWPSEEHVSVLNQFRVFFHFTTAAHSQLFFLHVAKITEHRKDSINLWRWLDEIEKDPSFASRLSVEIKELREQLQTYDALINRIKTHRHKRIAHVDERHSWPDSNIWQDNIVTIGEAKKLLGALESGFNKVSAAYDGQIWSLRSIGLEDTSSLLKKLLVKSPTDHL